MRELARAVGADGAAAMLVGVDERREGRGRLDGGIKPQTQFRQE
jgi:hypothetical protein